MYKYSRKMFFDQCGPTSKLATAVNNVCTHLGWLFQRQSDKDYPRTKFSRGVQKGIMMGHEYTGVQLVMVAMLRSAKGRNVLMDPRIKSRKEGFFPDLKWVSDWILLLETQLMFEQWLKKPTMSVTVVKRLRTKVRELMELTKTVGKRTKGMGFNIMNFHSIKHACYDILVNGVPSNVNTMSNEMHHKADKKSAKRTQKRPKTYDIQCCRKIEDRRVIDIGMEELGGRKRWEYFMGFRHKTSNNLPEVEPVEAKLAGVKAEFEHSSDKDEWVLRLTTDMKAVKKFGFSPNVTRALVDLAEEVSEYQDVLLVRSQLVMPEGNIYRATSHFQGKPWFDWGMFRYNEGEDIAITPFDDGANPPIMPAHLRCFIDLRNLPENNTTKFEPTIYIMAETVTRNTDSGEAIQCELFQPYVKETRIIPGTTTAINQMRIFPVDALEGPACVIPDLANKSNRAFQRVIPMKQWADLFELWVNDPHMRDFDEPEIT
jgi:hypothetical protein